MKYQAGTRRRAKEYEKAVLEFWKKDKTFEKSVEQRPIDDSYVFYDGPPFITGNPHHGTLLSSIVKDAVPRFWTMNGKRVERRWGWDCHGLPAENFVEKQLGITDRREIGTKWSLEEYITKARESMVANSKTWKDTIERVGRWVDFDGAYRTMDKDYMESVWWAFKQLYQAGKIYEGRKVLMYDTKFATPVSKAEVTMDNDAYQVVTDPSAYVKFKVLSESGEAFLSFQSYERIYLLAWTTTPWTLPANLCLAVNPKMKYGVYEVDNDGEKEYLVLAVDLAKKVLPELEPTEVFKGEKLIGVEYEPIVENFTSEEKKAETYTVLAADFVSNEDGTGIVHIAPAYGEDDYNLSLEHDVDFVDVLDDNGYYLPEVADKLHKMGVRDTDEHGIEAWAGNKFIAKCLEELGVVWKIEYIQHEYPFNPRSKQRIMYRAFPSWFFDVQNSKSLMLEQNENVNWFPAYLKHGRFAKNIEQAPDWNLSRDRFWATAMPVWKSEEGTVVVVGSYDELYELSGQRLDDYHRPWVDEVEFDAWVKDGEVVKGARAGKKSMVRGAKKEHFKRIEKVLDCWFESGSMPFAQLHYPFENKEKFERNYPADFIVEYVGQVRAWFYYIHCVNTSLASIGAFATSSQKHLNPFSNVITTGTLAGNDGRKMSKSLGNYTDPNELMDKFSADSLRFLLLSSPVLAGEDFALLDKDVSDVARKLAMVWNVYDFFTMYASVDGLEVSDEDGEPTFIFGAQPRERTSYHFAEYASARSQGKRSENEDEPTILSISNPLDIWIVSRIYQLRDDITEGMEQYNLPQALDSVLPFIDDLSNWFVRRSRRRFWKSEDDGDKLEAYATLYYVLVYLSKILAPITPYLAEELYQKMTGAVEEFGEDDPRHSVHLLDWPEAGVIDTEVLEEMARTREVITEGLALRMQKSEAEDQIKVRQPLSAMTYPGEKLPEFYEQIIAEEVNVKKVEAGDEIFLNKSLTPELKAEGYARELIRCVQAARKKAGLNVDDRIKLSLSVVLEKKWEEMVKAEVLAVKLESGEKYEHQGKAKVNGEEVEISLEKAES